MVQKNYKILVVDDHLLIRQMMTMTLTRAGCTSVETADDGAIGLKKINEALNQSSPFDIVFLDWSMPSQDGLDLLKLCRQNTRLSKMAIIMLTSESEDENITKALNAGATAYIVKPFRPEHILQKIEGIEGWRASLKG